MKLRDQGESLRDVGRVFGISREGARQLIERGRRVMERHRRVLIEEDKELVIPEKTS